jgi:hypothetical protein
MAEAPKLTFPKIELPSLLARPNPAPPPPQPPPPPAEQPDDLVLTKDDLTAMGVILTRLVVAQDAKSAAEAEKKAAEARFADADKRWNAARAAFAAFGFITTSSTLWPGVREYMGEDAWNAAFARARGSADDDEERNSTSQVPATGPEIEPPSGGPPASMPTVREIALAQLRIAGDAGTRAAAIRDYIAQTYHHQVHEKTVGMTLYRLLKLGLARREGHT